MADRAGAVSVVTELAMTMAETGQHDYFMLSEDEKVARVVSTAEHLVLPILEALRSLPIERRMEAMGMVEVTLGSDADPWFVDPFEHVPWQDGGTYWTARP